MAANELLKEVNAKQRWKPLQIASWPHLIGFLLIGAGVVAFGAFAQHAPAGGGGTAPGQLASHSKAIPIYLTAILMDWALLYYCWGGVHRGGGNLKTLSGGRMEKRDSDQRAGSSVRRAGRVAKKPAHQHRDPCMDRRVGGLAQVCSEA